MTKNLIAVSMMACLLASCSSEHCSKGDGCLNEKVVAYLNDKCRTGASENCRLSFKEAVGDFDKVYFVGTLGARLDQCKIIAAKDSLKRSYTPLCQYILFEKEREVKSYLRGFCTSEVAISENRVGFDPTNAGFLSRMDANKSVIVKKTFDNQLPGSQKYIYSIELQNGDLEKLTGREDTCVGLQ